MIQRTLCFIALTVIAAPSIAGACAVCAGDPESPLTHGARNGVMVMVLITYALILGFGGMFAAKILHARRQAANTSDDQIADV